MRRVRAGPAPTRAPRSWAWPGFSAADGGEVRWLDAVCRVELLAEHVFGQHRVLGLPDGLSGDYGVCGGVYRRLRRWLLGQAGRHPFRRQGGILRVRWRGEDGAVRPRQSRSTQWVYLVGTADGVNASIWVNVVQASVAAGATFTGYTVNDFFVAGGHSTLLPGTITKVALYSGRGDGRYRDGRPVQPRTRRGALSTGGPADLGGRRDLAGRGDATNARRGT